MAVDLSSSHNSLPLVSDIATPENISSFDAVQRDPTSWSGSLPANQGLYLNEQEKDSCGVGFVCHVKGKPSHKIVSDARQLLCSMTHRGATGADSRDGDGAGVMTSIPHEFFQREAEREIGCTLPQAGHYAVGNVFFRRNDPVQLQTCQATFSKIAQDLGLRVLGWREVPTDGTILGPAASSKEPTILQPFVVLRATYGDGTVSIGGTFDPTHFERQLYVLRKHATHTMFVNSCSSIVNAEAEHVWTCSFPKVRSPKGSMFAPFLPRTLFTRANFPLPKFTTTIMTLTMFFIAPTLPWFIPVSRRIHFLVGIVLNL